MFIVPTLFGLGCCLAIWLAAPEAKGFALGLLLVWAGANAAWFYNQMDILPVLDLAMGFYAVYRLRFKNTFYLWALTQLIGARLVLHVLDDLTGSLFIVPYIHGLNLLFMTELLVISHTGGLGIGVSMLRGLRSVRLFLRSPKAI